MNKGFGFKKKEDEDNTTLEQEATVNIDYGMNDENGAENESEESSMENNTETTTPVKDPTSRLERILLNHSPEYTDEVSKAFQALTQKDPEAAATIYMNAIVTTLQVFKGDINAMAQELGIDDRNIAMAEYEANTRFNGGAPNAIKK